MKEKIFEVSDRFFIKGRGTVVTGILQTDRVIKIGTPVVIIRPDNSEIKSEIRGADFFTRSFTENRTVGILIKDVAKEDVTIGSELFIEV